MRPLKIGMIAACPFPANHGSPALIREISHALMRRGHGVHIMTYPMWNDIPVNGLAVHRVSPRLKKSRIVVGPSLNRPYLDMLLVQKTVSVIRREKIDIIHGHNYEGALIGFLASKITGLPFVYNAVNTMISELPSYGFIRPQCLAGILARILDRVVPRLADHVCCLTREIYLFLEQYGVQSQRMSIVPATIDPQPFLSIDGKCIRQRYGLEQAPLVVYTGTLDRFQTVDYLIRAMVLVNKRVPGAKLMLVGSILRQRDVQSCRKLVSELQMEKSIIFTDEQPFKEMPHYLAAADIVVNPRIDCPGFPIKLLNYMAAGKPIVSFEGSAKDLVDRQNALLIKNGDWDSFGEAISELLQDQDLRLRLGNNARDLCKSNFHPDRISEQLEQVYSHLLQNDGGNR